MTEPPGPPFPPSGPPSGLNFSRWTDATPLPPRPAATYNVTRSTNDGTAMAAPEMERRACPSRGRPSVSGRWALLAGRNDVHDPATAPGAELDVALDQREQRVVATAADA